MLSQVGKCIFRYFEGSLFEKIEWNLANFGFMAITHSPDKHKVSNGYEKKSQNQLLVVSGNNYIFPHHFLRIFTFFASIASITGTDINHIKPHHLVLSFDSILWFSVFSARHQQNLKKLVCIACWFYHNVSLWEREEKKFFPLFSQLQTIHRETFFGDFKAVRLRKLHFCVSRFGVHFFFLLISVRNLRNFEKFLHLPQLWSKSTPIRIIFQKVFRHHPFKNRILQVLYFPLFLQKKNTHNFKPWCNNFRPKVPKSTKNVIFK